MKFNSASNEQQFYEICELAQVANLLLGQNAELLTRVMTIASKTVSSTHHIVESIALIKNVWDFDEECLHDDPRVSDLVKVALSAARHASRATAQSSLEIREIIGNPITLKKLCALTPNSHGTTMIQFETHLIDLQKRAAEAAKQSRNEKNLGIVEQRVGSMADAARLNNEIASHAASAVEKLQLEIMHFVRIIEKNYNF